MSTRLMGYQLYKRDTDVYVTWIFRAAKLHGAHIQTIGKVEDDGASIVCYVRLEGGRMLIVQQDEPRKYLVTTQEILDEVHLLSKVPDTLIMAPAVKRSFRRAVYSRKRYSVRYATENIEAVAANDGHVYFIYVLEESARLLTAIVSVQAVAKAIPDTGPTNDAILLSNVFNTPWTSMTRSS
jgi:hypothetical protein